MANAFLEALKRQKLQQMSHQPQQLPPDLLGAVARAEGNLYDKSLIYKSLKDAFTAPMRAYEGEFDPMSPYGVQEALNTAGMAMLGGMPGGPRGFGSVGAGPSRRPYTPDAQPPAEGMKRLYRAESPTTKFDDVFDREKLPEFATDKTGTRFTDDLKYANYFRKSYGPDAQLSYVDVPIELAEKGRLNEFEFRVDLPSGRPRNALGQEIPPTMPEYQGLHRPPMKDSGAPLHDLTGGGNFYPDDVYSANGLRYYGTGDDAIDREAWNLAMQAKGRPNKPVRMYRAVPYEKTPTEQIAQIQKQKDKFMSRGTVPSEFGGNGSRFYDWATSEIERLKALPVEKPTKVKINHGDWVTTSKAYAKQHGEGALGGNYKIISSVVPAKRLFTNGDSWAEFGYDSTVPGLAVPVASTALLSYLLGGSNEAEAGNLYDYMSRE